MKNTFILNLLKNSINKIYPEIEINISLETPKIAEHGDISSNVAMQLAKLLKKNPTDIANSIVSNLEIDNSLIDKVEVAKPGFINFKLSKKYYQNELINIINLKNDFGKSNIGVGKKINVEYVSANPTGLLHLGHGRNAVIGDVIANLYEWCGYYVDREYYFNNAGNQMNNLAKSTYARYEQIFNPNYPFPDDGYHGDYIKIIALEIYQKYGDNLRELNQKNLEIFKKYAEEWCFSAIKRTLTKLRIEQNIFFNEDTLYKNGKLNEVINRLKNLGYAYEKDGATWLKLTELGLEEDRVIIKSTGEPTYRLPDIAYHTVKLDRGYDLVIDVFGADHIATVPDVLAGVKALGYDNSKIKVLIHQFITLTENGQQVKMSKRTGKSYTLDDLLEEVGTDVVRFFFIMRSINTHLEFDLNLAKEQSEKNPVFYLQYAHARICSIIEKIKDEIVNFDPLKSNLELLNTNEEINLIKKLIDFPEVVENSAIKFEPQILTEYLKELAAEFHKFYHSCKIIGSEEDLKNARLSLVYATKNTLYNGLKILKINAPEKM